MNQDGTPVSPKPPIFSGAAPSSQSNSNVPGYFNKAMGDIVIDDPNAKKKKNKLPFIIGGAVLLVVVIVAVAVVMFIPTAQKNSAKNATRIAFNRFANYMISGEEKENDIPDNYDKNKIYNAGIWLSSYTVDKDDKGFFAEALKKYEVFYNEAKNSVPEEKTMESKTPNAIIRYRFLFL